MKQQFRHKDGCCICATKSSTTRFQSSADYEASFAQVFGAKARNRSGHICNACILCIRRGAAGNGGSNSGGGGSPSYSSAGPNKAPYANVVDSRRGTGPKHMKQISKRNRRREQREAAAAKVGVGGSGGGNVSGNFNGAGNGSSLGSNGKQQSADGGCGGVDLLPQTASGLGGLAGLSGNGGIGSGGCGGLAALPGRIGQDGEFRAPLAPPSSGGATGRRRQQYYKKRVIMQPVKIPDSKEIGELFQDVMQSRCITQSDGPLSFQQVHSAFLTTKRRRLLAGGGSETASVTSTEAPESFTSDTPSAGGSGASL